MNISLYFFFLLIGIIYFADLGDARHLSRALMSAWLVRGSSFPVPKLISAVLDVLKKDNLPESRISFSISSMSRLIRI